MSFMQDIHSYHHKTSIAARANLKCSSALLFSLLLSIKTNIGRFIIKHRLKELLTIQV